MLWQSTAARAENATHTTVDVPPSPSTLDPCHAAFAASYAL